MAAQTVFEFGEDVSLHGEFRTPAGVLQDPGAVFLTVKRPGGTVNTYSYSASQVTKDGTGEYSKVIDANASGWWYYRWWSTGTGKGAQSGRFRVLEDPTGSRVHK